MGRFKKGLFFGGLFGAAFTWLSVTKKGKEMRGKLLDSAADIYEDVKTKVSDPEVWNNMTKNKYISMVKETVDKYAKQNEMAGNAKNMIVKVVSSQWKNLQKEIGKKDTCKKCK